MNKFNEKIRTSRTIEEKTKHRQAFKDTLELKRKGLTMTNSKFQQQVTLYHRLEKEFGCFGWYSRYRTASVPLGKKKTPQALKLRKTSKLSERVIG